MSTDYNAIAKEYQASKLQPWRKHIEAHTLFNLVGDVANKSVLDLACGEGFYTRQLKLRGAKNVEGVDLSDGMIELANALENENPLGITYHVHDVLNLDLNKKFDLITASYLLNYAQTAEDLEKFGSVIAKHLNPGGRFVTINSNPDYKAPVETTRKYGFTRQNEGYFEGAEIVYRFFQEDGNYIDVVNYHLEKETHNKALAKAGLTDIVWHNTALSADGAAEFGAAYWSAILDTQPVIGLTCKKP